MTLTNWFRAACGLFLFMTVGLRPARAQVADSLFSPQLSRWPLATQLRLVPHDIPRADLPRVEPLAHAPALPALLRARLQLQLARAYYRELQSNLARIRALEARQLGLQLQDSALLSDVSSDLCFNYQALQQPRLGIECGEQAIRWAPRATRAQKVGRAYTMLGACAMMLRDYPLALRYYSASLEAERPRRQWANIFVGYDNMALTYLELHQLPRARQYYDSATACLPRIRVQEDSIPDYVTTYWQHLRADLARHEGRPAEAVPILEKLIGRMRAQRVPVYEGELIKSIKPALVQLGRYREALAYQDRYVELLDTVYEQSASRQAQEMQVLYDTQRKEQELSQQRHHIEELRGQARQREAESRQQRRLYGAGLLGALLMLGGVVAYQRARHTLAARAAAQRMRTRIAADLHDEVGTLLTRVSMQADMLRQLQPEPSPALDRLLSNSRQAAGVMRDIVWGIDAQSDTTTALLDRMREFLHQSAAPAGLEAELQTADWPDDEMLPQLLRQQVYLVFKEAVTNAVKHAREAQLIRVELRRAAGRLRLTVANDGQLATVSSTTGLGLRSMRQRAASVGGTLAAGPRPEGGFLVVLDAPLQYD